MVFPGEEDCMATGHERPKKALHNFNFSFSSWGIQHKMRCVKAEVGLEEFGKKMMSDIRTARESIFREHEEEKDESEELTKKERETVEVQRWNLRKRRADCEASLIELGFVKEKVNTRPTFNLALSKKEVEDDMMMMGLPPGRRPKKRSRALQQKINLLHPGFYFSQQVTEDTYKVEKEKR